MTSAGLLVCLTFITNVSHGSVVTHECHDKVPHLVATESFAAPDESISLIAKTISKADQKQKFVSKVKFKTTSRKLHFRKLAFRKTKAHHYAARVIVKPDSPPEKKSFFNFSWLKQMAGE